MDFNLTEDQLAFREAARAFAEKSMAPHAAKWDNEHIFPVDVMKEAGEMGFMGMYTPEALGGMGLSGWTPRSSWKSSLLRALRPPRLSLSTTWLPGWSPALRRMISSRKSCLNSPAANGSHPTA